jgi:hypothetical protein
MAGCICRFESRLILTHFMSHSKTICDARGSFFLPLKGRAVWAEREPRFLYACGGRETRT